MTTQVTSMLFVPGGDEAKLAKVATLKAPALILDLEDAVAHARKAQARELVACTIAEGLPVPVWVRVNAHQPHATVADLSAVVRPGLAGVLLPKVQHPQDVHAVSWLLTALEHERDMPTGSIRVMPTIETVAGLASVNAIAVSNPRIDCLVFGAGDFSTDAGLDWPQPGGGVGELLLSAKRRLVLASRLAGLAPPHDGAYPMFRDDGGLVTEAEQSRRLGMFGKHAIHPRQVPLIDGVFTPTAAQLEHARAVVEAFDVSEAAGVGNLDLGGQFVDYPVVERARALLALAKRLAAAGTRA